MNDNEYDLNSKISGEFDPSFFKNKFRVKLYNLNAEGQWDDMGTGHVSIKEDVIIYVIISLRMTIITLN
jgi:hypothetical protein